MQPSADACDFEKHLSDIFHEKFQAQCDAYTEFSWEGGSSIKGVVNATKEFEEAKRNLQLFQMPTHVTRSCPDGIRAWRPKP